MIDWLALPALVMLTILVALWFDFYNGMNDSANSIATVVATRALPPWAAVTMAATFNFLGAFIGLEVAKTIGSGIIDTNDVDTHLILAALLGGLAWTWFATHSGIPISVSHSLIGGLVGAALVADGLGGIAATPWSKLGPVWTALGVGALAGVAVAWVVSFFGARRFGLAALGGAFMGSAMGLLVLLAVFQFKLPKLFATLLFIVYSPLFGFLLAAVFMIIILWLFRRWRPHQVKGSFRWLQVGSASFYSLSHGQNDAQKTMGVITALLLANNLLGTDEFVVPLEVIVLSGLAIALGTLIGGYKVVRTMGHQLTHLDTHQGFAAETSSAIGLTLLAGAGVPVSTTHSITGSIMGVGAVQRVSAVSWGTARRIMLAWVITIPASAAVAGLGFVVLGWFLK